MTSINDTVFGSHTYEYDYRGFLKKEDNLEYSYDKNGNITSKGTIEYEYDSNIKDRLVSYNGKAITYHEDNPGCIKTYDGNTYEFEGRRLVKITTSDNKIIRYDYDDQGLRTKKEIEENGVVKVIYYSNEGGKLVSEYTSSKHIMYLYDEYDMLYGFIYNDNRYYYVRDCMQNILGIIADNGELVVKYEYTAYGEIKSISGTLKDTIGVINPFRYKGYYYDEETEMFYCKSRYYKPEWCRFITVDSVNYIEPGNINGINLYAYCGNDPINMYDPTGHFGIWALVAITAASMLIGGTAQLVSNAMAGKTGSELWRGVAGAAVGAGVNALALCLAMPTGGASLFIAAGASAIAQTGVDTLETVIRGEEVDVGQTFIDLGLNFVTTLAGNYLGGKMVPTNRGWIQTQRFWSVFTKPYGQKILLQTAIGAGLSGTVNFIRKNDWSKYKPIIPMPVLPLYPLF